MNLRHVIAVSALTALFSAGCQPPSDEEAAPVSEMPPMPQSERARIAARDAELAAMAAEHVNDARILPRARRLESFATGPQKQLVYVDFNGGTLTHCDGANNAQNSCFPWLKQDSQAYGAWGNTDDHHVILGALRMYFTGVDVDFTTDKPSSGPYTRLVITHTAVNADLPNSPYRGLSHMDCGAADPNDLSVIVDTADDEHDHRLLAVAKLSAHELGHTFGLEHTDSPWDLMYPIIDDSVAFGYWPIFKNAESQCLAGLYNQDDEHRLHSWVGITTVPLRPRLNSRIAVASMHPGRYDLFARSYQGTVIHRWFDGSWSYWEDLGGFATSDVAAVSWSDGRLDVFTRGGDNTLWHKWYQSGSGWSGWESLGGTLTSAPSVASPSAGLLDVYVRGPNNQVFRKAFWGGWGNWEGLGGDINGTPAATSWGNGNLDVFARGWNDHMYHKYWTGSAWSAWEDLGGTLQSSPAAFSPAPGIVDTYVRGPDDAVWRKSYWNGWGDWSSLGGYITTAPGADSWAPGRADVFVRGNDYMMYQRYYDGSAWSSSWVPL